MEFLTSILLLFSNFVNTNIDNGVIKDISKYFILQNEAQVKNIDMTTIDTLVQTKPNISEFNKLVEEYNSLRDIKKYEKMSDYKKKKNLIEFDISDLKIN